MEYPRIKELLQDDSYVTQLMNHLLPLNHEDRAFVPITDGWMYRCLWKASQTVSGISS